MRLLHGFQMSEISFRIDVEFLLEHCQVEFVAENTVVLASDLTGESHTKVAIQR